MSGLSEFIILPNSNSPCYGLSRPYPACLNGVPSLTVVNFACYCCVCFQSVDSVQ